MFEIKKYTEHITLCIFCYFYYFDMSVKRSFDTHLIPGLLRCYAASAILQYISPNPLIYCVNRYCLRSASVGDDIPPDVLHLVFGVSQVQKPYRASTNGFLTLTLVSLFSHHICMKHIQHTRQFLFRLNRRQKDCFELGRCKMTTILEHVLEVLREGFRIRSLCCCIVDYRSLCEEEGTDGTNMVDLVVLLLDLFQNIFSFHPRTSHSSGCWLLPSDDTSDARNSNKLLLLLKNTFVPSKKNYANQCEQKLVI